MNAVLSMTGFAGVSRENTLGVLALELRSVNHRYLELSWKGPDELRQLEIPMREAIQKAIGRGKVECRVSYKARLPGMTGHPNPSVLSHLSLWQSEVLRAMPQAQPLSVADVLAWPGILEGAEIDGEALSKEVMALLQEALDQLSASRAREGERLKTVLLERVSEIERIRTEVAPRIPALVSDYQQRLSEKLRDALGHEEEERVRQEVFLYATKIDVEEEIARLGVHVAETRRILETGGAVGKRLDFLMQELNREANTLGSKSVSSHTSQASMALKLLIEQMREQIQNLE